VKCTSVTLQWCCKPLVSVTSTVVVLITGCWNIRTLVEADGDICTILVGDIWWLIGK